jgi:hypothetical protein
MSKRITDFQGPSFQKKLPVLIEEYVESCRPPADADPKKSVGRLPNLAGFCRYLGCALSDLQTLRTSNARLFERLSAVFEDELLNHSPSPTIMSAYLKKRLGYAEETSEDEKGADGVQMNLIFEHDIVHDGA